MCSSDLSGSGTITTATASGFADWPSQGWARIKTSGGTLREIVYYTSRTATSLTVPSAGRARLGSSAAAGSATDTVDAVPGLRIGLEALGSEGTIQTVASAARVRPRMNARRACLSTLMTGQISHPCARPPRIIRTG